MDYLKDCRFGVDWFNIVIDNSDDVIGLVNYFSFLNNEMDLKNWTVANAQRGYKRSLHFMGRNFIQLAFNPSEDNEFKADMNHPTNKGILVSISGDGCRYLSSYGILSDTLLYFKSLGCHCTRLDVYMDIFNKENILVDTLISSFRSMVFSSHYNGTGVSSNMHFVNSNGKDKGNVIFTQVVDPFDGSEATNLTFGNHGSSFGMFRCYNKGAEISTGRLSSCSEELLSDKNYWYRLEYEVHKGHADYYFDMLTLLNGSFDVTLPHVYSEIASNMFRLVTIPRLGVQLTRCDTVDVWEDFVSSLINLTFIQENIDDLVSIPYIKRTDFDSLVTNGNRIKGYFYALLTAFFSSESFRNDILRYGREKFECSPQYAELRSELPLIDIKSLIKEVA